MESDDVEPMLNEDDLEEFERNQLVIDHECGTTTNRRWMKTSKKSVT